MKNIVFMPAINVDNVRSKPYEYGINSFKHWCKNNNCELVILDELLYPIDYMKITFQRYHVFDVLEHNNIEYDKVWITDADCIIHPECRNPFDLVGDSYGVCRTRGSYDWVCRSMENYSKYVFEGQTFPITDYFNGGFQIVNKSHKELLNSYISFYQENKDLLQSMNKTFGVGTDQPIVNFLSRKMGVDIKFLPYEFCMTDLHRWELLNPDMEFTKYKGVYQFNAIPDNHDASKTLYWMEKTYKHLYEKN